MSQLFRNASGALAIALALMPASAFAASIFVNGTQVDGALSNYKLEKCTANFDAKGDLHLDCPGYNFQIETEEGLAPAPKTAAPATSPAAPATEATAPATPGAPQAMVIKPKISNQYVLFSSQSTVGATGFDVDVFINGTLAARLKNDDAQIVEEVTEHLRKGENTVTFVARKQQAIREVKANPGDYYEIQISEGAIDPEADTLVIKAGTGIQWRITAAETLDNTKEMKLDAQ